MSLGAREIAEREVERVRVKTGFPLDTILQHAGISQRTWREWGERRGIKTAHNNNIPKNYFITPQEEEAVIAYCWTLPH
jgi:hypothetical protein